MSETKSKIHTPPGDGGRRKLMYIAGALVVLVVVALIAAWFVVTSGGFFKGVILPRVGKALNAEITVSEAQIRPFSKTTLRGLQVTPRGGDSLLTAREISARLRLLAMLGGTIAVDEIVVENPVVTVVETPEGTSNVQPLLQALETPADQSPAQPTAPPSLDIKVVRVNNGMVRRTKHLKNGGRDAIELANLNLTLTGLKNGQAGKLDLAAVMAMASTATTDAPADALSGAVRGDFTFTLAPDLIPTALNGQATLTVDKAMGAYADFATLVVQFDAQASPTEIQQLAIRFTRGADSLGELRVSGPFDAEKLEGKLQVQLTGVDRKLLNLAGAAAGLDFGGTTASMVGQVELTQAGSRIAANGQWRVNQFQVTRAGQTTPTLDLNCEYDVTVDNTSESAVVKTLNLAGTQGARPLVQAALTAPMTIAWGKTANAVGDSALNLTVTGLDLADWKPFVGDIAPAGQVDVTAKLLSQQAGQLLQFEGRTDARNLIVLVDTNRFSDLQLTAETRGQARELKQFKLNAFTVQLAQNNQPTLTAEGTGNYDLAANTANADARVRAVLPALVQMLAIPAATVTAGNLEVHAQVTHKETTQTAVGKAVLTGFTGGFGETQLAEFGGEADFDVVKTGDQVQLRKTVGKLTERAQACGDFEVTGQYNLATDAGEGTVKLGNFNQNALRPFLAAALGDNQLVSATVNSVVTATMAANGDATAKADFHLTNLMVKDLQGKLPQTPLEMRLRTDAAVAQQVAQVRQCQLNLTPTDRAANELNLAGSVDFSQSNAITGNLKLIAEALDLTRYYDLFAGDATNKPPATAAAADDPTKEPDAWDLPFRNFTFEAAIGRLHLRDVAITNWTTTAKLNGGRVQVQPFQLTLNGAPVNATADLDLGVPGFKYDLSFQADQVPLAPLVDSFVPERRGQIGGVTTVGAQIKGAGVTGAGLQRNLTGQFSMLSTNLGLSIAEVRNPIVNTIINVIVGIPDLIRNPTAIVGNMLGRLTGADRPRGGWADQLTEAPIEVMEIRGSAGNGQVELQTAEVRSAAFQARATGGIGLQPILTNSTLQIPVTISLNRTLSERVGLGGGNLPTNQVYVALPDFVGIKGTLGDPKADINKLALAGLAARTGLGVATQIGGAVIEKPGKILGTVGSLLGVGSTTMTTNAPATNAPAADPAGNLLRGLGTILGGSRPAAPTTNAPPPR
jgi:uncharacterized protein involved in outer membrane biogenesis